MLPVNECTNAGYLEVGVVKARSQRSDVRLERPVMEGLVQATGTTHPLFLWRLDRIDDGSDHNFAGV